jgi:ATP-dependent RNA circularization protein (DNA/RNA ligase family)
MQVANSQNEIKETCKMQTTLIEQKNETNKPTNVDDYKILKDYAVKHNAKNINAYINTLKKSGSDKQIIKDYKKSAANNKAMLEAAEQNIKDLEYAKQNMWHPSKDYFEQIRQKLTIC